MRPPLHPDVNNNRSMYALICTRFRFDPLCVEILKMFERHFASFKWQKLLVIVELKRQSMTFSVGCLPVAHHVKIRFGLFLIVRTIAKPANRIAENLYRLLLLPS